MKPWSLLLSAMLAGAAPLAMSARADGPAWSQPPPPDANGRYYVSASTGNDANPGTLVAPFRTLGRIVPFLKPGQTCVLRAGVYRETLRPAGDGEPGAPILFEAPPRETVVLSGLDPVPAQWTSQGGGVFRARLDAALPAKNLMVFIDGELMHEARWPNTQSDDLMKPQGARIGAKSTTSTITSPELPANVGPDFFKGGTVWVLAQSKWSSWTSPVTGYDPARRTLRYEPFTGTPKEWWVDEKHRPGEGRPGMFYVSGAPRLLDAPGEWYYDEKTRELSLIPPAGKTPRPGNVEVASRRVAIDLRGRSCVVVKGLTVLGATADLTDATHCTLERLAFRYLSHTRGGRTVNDLEEPTGIAVSGRENTLRECDIAFSAGKGVDVGGTRNVVVNNFIHDIDSMGVYASAITLHGRENMVCYNTLRRAGRDCLTPKGGDDRIFFNDISQAGVICSDVGLIYAAGTDGDNTEIAYNWVHDAPGRMTMGIYLDNYDINYLVHHNVVWGVKGQAIRLNRPASFHLVANNSLQNELTASYCRWQYPVTMPGVRLFNNLAGGSIQSLGGALSLANLVRQADWGFDPAQRGASPARPGRGAGIFLPGVSLPGKTADAGAYETSAAAWRPGHDFARAPQIVFPSENRPLRQLLANGAFERGLDGWTADGGATVENFPGFNYPGPEARNSIHADALVLPGAASASQQVPGLVAGCAYSLMGNARLNDGAAAELGVEFPDGRVLTRAFASTGQWDFRSLAFVLPDGATSARVFLRRKGGAGVAFFDDIGMLLQWPQPSPNPPP